MPEMQGIIKGAPVCAQPMPAMRLNLPMCENVVGLTTGELETRLAQYRSEVLNVVQKECSSLHLQVNALMRQEVLPLKDEMKALSSLLKMERSDEVRQAQTLLEEQISAMSSSFNDELEKMVTMVNEVSGACEKHFERLATKQEKLSSALFDVNKELAGQRSATLACDERIGNLEAELRQNISLLATKAETMEAARSSRQELGMQLQEQLIELRQGLEVVLTEIKHDRRSDYDQLTQMVHTEREERSQQIATASECDAKFEVRLLEAEKASEKTWLVYDWMISKRAREKDKHILIQKLSQSPQSFDQYRADLSCRGGR
jgi:hypothetical protein